jgi:tetratricopeptide (TPR) repeat protein
MQVLIIRAVLAISLMFTAAANRVASQATDQSSAIAPGTAKKPETPRVTASDSIVVGAHLTPEEIEDGKINDVYQPIYHWSRQTDCPQIVMLCETKIIPMAEGSKFDKTRNKFLYLANESIAGCEMRAGKYQEAEQRYQMQFKYMTVWPGTTDSDYPENFRAIGTARIMQGRWKDAETSLEKAIELFGEQIDTAMHSDSEFFRNEHSKNLRVSEARVRNLLAVAYFRDGRETEAMGMLEKAYQEALQSSATPEMLQQIIESGRTAAAMIGDSSAKQKWDERNVPIGKSPP